MEEEEDFLAPLRVSRPEQPALSPRAQELRAQGTIARVNMALASFGDVQPGTEAEMRRLAERQNIPLAAARAAGVDNLRRTNAMDTVANSPTVRRAFGDENRARIMADDTDQLSALDNVFNAFRTAAAPFVPGVTMLPEVVSFAQSIPRETLQAGRNVSRTQPFAAAAGAIVPGAPLLPYVERAVSGAVLGGARARVQAELGDRIFFDDLTRRSAPTDVRTREEIALLTSEFERTQRAREEFGVAAWVGETVGYTGAQLAIGLLEAPPGVAAGAVGGGLIGGAITRRPEGVVTGGRIGGGLGLAASQSFFNFRQEAGLAFLEYQNMRLADGTRIDRETARGAAFVTGGINAVLETGADLLLTRLAIPGVDRLLNKPAKEVVDELLQTPAGQDALRQVASRAAQAATVEGFTELLQEIVNVATGQTALASAEGVAALPAVGFGLSEALRQENLARAGQAGLEGVIGGAGVTVVTSPATIPLENYFRERDLRAQRQRAQTATGRIELVERAIETAGRTRLVDRDRGELAQFINEATEESPVSTIYVSLADAAQLAQEQNTTVEDIVRRMGGTAETIAAAEASGFAMEIPIGDFVASVTKTDLASAAVQIIKTNPLLYTRRELEVLATEGQEQAIAVAERLAAAAQNDVELQAGILDVQAELERAIEPVRAQLAAAIEPVVGEAGAAQQLGRASAIPYAKIAAEGYGVIAQVLGITPREAMTRYPLRIGEMQVGPNLGQPIEEGAPVEGGPIVRAVTREIPVLPEFGTPEWTAMVQAAQDKQARGEALTTNERALINMGREDAAELTRILDRIRNGQELTPASQRFLRERGYDPVTGQRVQDETLGPEETLGQEAKSFSEAFSFSDQQVLEWYAENVTATIEPGSIGAQDLAVLDAVLKYKAKPEHKQRLARTEFVASAGSRLNGLGPSYLAAISFYRGVTERPTAAARAQTKTEQATARSLFRSMFLATRGFILTNPDLNQPIVFTGATPAHSRVYQTFLRRAPITGWKPYETTQTIEVTGPDGRVEFTSTSTYFVLAPESLDFSAFTDTVNEKVNADGRTVRTAQTGYKQLAGPGRPAPGLAGGPDGVVPEPAPAVPEGTETLGAGFEGGRRGQYNIAQQRIELSSNSDFSTFLHELGHHFLEVNNKIALDLLDRQKRGEMLTTRQQQHLDDMRLLLNEAIKRSGIEPGEALPEGVVFQAQQEGYLGQDPIEAQEWLRAKAKGLDMSPEGRMKRARAMGFDTERVLYHGTLEDLTEFKPHGKFMGHKGISGISLTDSREAASRYLNRFGNFQYDGKPFQKNIMPVFIRWRRRAEMNEPIPTLRGSGLGMGMPLPPDYAWPKSLDGIDVVEFPDRITAKGDVAHWKPGDEELLSELSSEGVVSGTEVIVRDPSNIRSIHAAFDPDFADSPNLLAQEGQDGAPPAAPEGEGPRPEQDVIEWFNSLSFEQRRPIHEAFAQMAETYFATGEAPTPRLKSLFEQFKEFMLKVYSDIQSFLGAPLSDEVRQAMDRFFIARTNVQRAEEGLGFTPAFATKPAFMSQQEWEGYQELTAQATREANGDLSTRLMRDMQWLSGAKSREMRRLQRQHAAERRAIREEVTVEVADKPVNRARRYLSRGLHPEDGSTTDGPHKLSIPALREQFGDRLDWRALGYGKYGLLAENGDHPEALATMLGYDSAEEMINDLLTAPKQADEIKAETDRRMLERYGETTSREALERAANEAVHSQLRGRAIHAQHMALAKAVGSRALLRENARAAAKIIVGRQPASKLSPRQAMAAERLAARRLMTALKANDLTAAATASRDQVLAFEITAETFRAQKAYQDARVLFRRVRAGKADEVAKRRNFDLVMVARGILAAFGEGSPKDAQKAKDYLKALQEYDPNLYEGLEPLIDQATKNAEQIDTLSVNRIAELEEVIQGIWNLSREQRTIEIDGRKVDAEAATQELLTQIESLPRLRKEKDAGFAETPSDKQKFIANILGLPASTNLVEEWSRTVDQMTEKKRIGPFMRFIFLRVKKASVAYRNEAADVYKKIEKIFEAHKNRITRDPIVAPLLITDGKPFRFRNKAELLHAIAHSGNASNLRALLLGYGWGRLMPDGQTVDDSAWRAQIDAFARDGIITKEDMDLVQSIWDLNESLKPAAQKAHRLVFGRYFNEITFEPVVTPFGTYKGGYMPLVYDEIQSPEFAAKANLEASAASFASLEGQGSLFPATPAGFAIERKKLTKQPRVKLDLTLVKTHVDKVLRFTHIAPAIKDTAKLLNNRELKAAINAYDPQIITYMIEPWLRRSMAQVVETRGSDAFQNWGLWRYVQSVSSMNIMMFNVVNSLLGPIGAPFMAAASLRGRAIIKATSVYYAQYLLNPKKTSESVHNLSPVMKERADRYAQASEQRIVQSLRPDPLEGLQAFFRNNAYIMQITFQQPSEIAFWLAEYNDQLSQGKTHQDAVDFADSAINRIFGSTNPEDISGVEAGSAFNRTFLQFFNYMNRWGRVLGSEIVQALRSEMHITGKANRLLYVIGFAYIGQILASETMMLLLRGTLEDEEEDGYLDDWFAAMGYGLVKTPLAFVPYAGGIGVAVLNNANDKPYDDRILTTPAIGTLERAGRVLGDYIWPWAGFFEGEDPQDIIDEFEDKSARKAIVDVASFLTLITGLPFIVPARSAAYAVGVETGEIEPTDELDYARGLVTGSASEASKQ